MANFHVQIRSGKPGQALPHCRYLTRFGWADCPKARELKFCQCKNLPSWAKDPADYYAGSDDFERSNGATYREMEVSLPRELGFEQNVDLLIRIADETQGNRPRLVVYHEGKSSLNGELNPHGHVMSSDRACDGVARTRETHFKRPNPKAPVKGGVKKLSGGMSPWEMGAQARKTRETVATMINQALIENGHDALVDHRSHKERGLSQAPERYLGSQGVKRLSKEQRKELLAKRKS